MADVTEAQITELADAAWHCLDDMGQHGKTVCAAAKAKLRVAYEPFLDAADPADYGWMTLAEAEAIMKEPANG